MRDPRRSTTVRSLMAIAFVIFPIAPAHAQDAVKRPNIVFILADDLGINDLACYGRKEHNTPNIDKLAERGIRFTNAYSSQSVGMPTRAAILTGQAPARLKFIHPSERLAANVAQLLLHPDSLHSLSKSDVTLPQRLKPAGYVSACVEKRELADVPIRIVNPPEWTAWGLAARNQATGDETESARSIERFIVDNKDTPFFLYTSINSPNPRVSVKKRFIDKNENAFNPGRAAAIESLDSDVGSLIAKLDELKIADKTLIVFTSDNGGRHMIGEFGGGRSPPTHNTPYRAGMGFLYEGGVRVPLIVCWPGRAKAGTTEATPVISTDWAPTLLAAAGIESKDKFDGVNLLDLIVRGKPIVPRPLYWHQPYYTRQGSRPAGAIREGAWKLIEHFETGACELFSLDQDAGEANDISAREPGRVADLRGKLEKWRRDIDAQELRPNPDFNPAFWKKLYADIDASRFHVADKAIFTPEKMGSWQTTMSAIMGLGPNPFLAPRRPVPADIDVRPGAGAVILYANRALVHGDKLRYEPQPQKDTLGFWVNKNDWLEWKFTPPHKGVFDVELLQACGKGSGGAEIEVTVAGQTLTMKVEDTGHFQRFVPRTIGTVKLNEGEPVTLAVRAKTKPGPAVMDLRRIMLRAAP